MLRQDFAELLRESGHNVLRAEDMGQTRADDAEILQVACIQGRTLITLDAHFGDWAVLPLSRHPGVIRLKMHPPTVTDLADVLLPFLKKHDQEQFRDHLVILTATRERWISTHSETS